MVRDVEIRRSPQTVACRNRYDENLGGPAGSSVCRKLSKGIGILRHVKGNPETELSPSLKDGRKQEKRKAMYDCEKENTPDACGESYRA
jgi:hypothetical protein